MTRVTSGGNPRGLSPLVRGKRKIIQGVVGVIGSIPACAGETVCSISRTSSARVYPRLCGGNVARTAASKHALGLSPLVRGKRNPRMSAQLPIGSIPACAGETPQNPSPSTTMWVYPRLCGGNTTKPESIYHYVGLSPLVRGKRLKDNRDKFFAGSIPACAGETIDGGPRHKMRWVYPRLCGGNHQRRGSGELALGLSPLVRGKHR